MENCNTFRKKTSYLTKLNLLRNIMSDSILFWVLFPLVSQSHRNREKWNSQEKLWSAQPEPSLLLNNSTCCCVSSWHSQMSIPCSSISLYMQQPNSLGPELGNSPALHLSWSKSCCRRQLIAGLRSVSYLDWCWLLQSIPSLYMQNVPKWAQNCLLHTVSETHASQNRRNQILGKILWHPRWVNICSTEQNCDDNTVNIKLEKVSSHGYQVKVLNQDIISTGVQQNCNTLKQKWLVLKICKKYTGDSKTSIKPWGYPSPMVNLMF